MNEIKDAVDLLKEINQNTLKILSVLEKHPKTTFLSVAGQASIFVGIVGGFVALADFILRLSGGKI